MVAGQKANCSGEVRTLWWIKMFLEPLVNPPSWAASGLGAVRSWQDRMLIARIRAYSGCRRKEGRHKTLREYSKTFVVSVALETPCFAWNATERVHEFSRRVRQKPCEMKVRKTMRRR